MSRRAGASLESAFVPWRHEVTGRWRPGRISLRRQAVLGQTLLQLGAPLPRSPKFDRIQARANAQAHSLQTQASAVDLREWNLSEEEDARVARTIAKGHRTHGPYAGRRIMFKGTLPERTAKSRKAGIAAKITSMPATIAEWRKVRNERSSPPVPLLTVLSQAKEDARKKQKPSLPF